MPDFDEYGYPKFNNGLSTLLNFNYNGPTYSLIKELLKYDSPIIYDKLEFVTNTKPTSEITRYINSKGELVFKPTTNGAMSGTDPLALFYIEGVALNKPIGWISSKIFKPFKSELNWTPESWFSTRYNGKFDIKDIKSLKSHIPEYLKIEREAKKNGTWLKMSDGSTWSGDPRSWVQLQSNSGKLLKQERLFNGIPKDEYLKNLEIYNGVVWTQPNKDMAIKWSKQTLSKNGNGKILELTYPKNTTVNTIDAQGNTFSNIPNIINYNISGYYTPKTLSSNSFVNISEKEGYNIAKINNIKEGFGHITDDTVILPNTPRKSLLGNNGDFNLLDKNIYKTITIPLLYGTYRRTKN